MEPKQYLEQHIRELCPDAPAGAADKLASFSAELKSWNEKFNLTSITDEKEIIIKHFIDSLQLVKSNNCSNCLTFLDVGAGAGFPSIPLAIIYPDRQFFLAESNNKKVTFLNHIASHLELDNVRIVAERSEDMSGDKDYREKFDCVLSRALAKFSIAMEICVALAKDKGLLAYYASQKQKQEILAEKRVFEKLKCGIESVFDYSLPEGMGEHSIIFVKKLWKTDGMYPRQFSQIKKNPL